MTHRWRAAVAAALVIVIAGSTPAPGVLATAGLAGPAPAGAIARNRTASAPASRPLPARAAVTLAAAIDSRAYVALPAATPGARALDTLARVPELSPAAPEAGTRAVTAARAKVPAPPRQHHGPSFERPGGRQGCGPSCATG